ncbi:MAG TPA: hypothetical protein VJ992_10225 [Gemmatimonadales bacterium]|nr:hypothetical protein [Gemmatimonadales bacterium]
MRRSACFLLAAVLAWPRPAHAQGVVLRFAPGGGLVAHALEETRTFTTLTGFPAVPDGARFEQLQRVAATERITPRAAGGWRVAITVDSVQRRIRPIAGTWRDEPDTVLAGRTARASVNDRFQITGIESSGASDAAVLRILGGSVAGLAFAFPDSALAEGDSFATGARFIYTARAPAGGGLPAEATLSGDLVLHVDSIIDTGGDSLTYFTFRGPFTPAAVESSGEAGMLRGTFQGAFGGMLIWSKAWNAFVSAVNRVRVAATLYVESSSGAFDASAHWDATITHRMRP